ncbi:putative DNA helicase Pif1-like protein, partial [Tanacetum coccineum]
VYTIEFQKHGLPHSHICIFIHPDDKILNNERIDDFISAEIPDEEADPQLYKLVSDHMMHGPCGPDNPSCPCTIKGKCTKKFPKTYSERTSTDSDGYPVYKRRDDGKFVEKSGVKLNNRFVVGYNSFLLKKYQAHINVEYCNQAGSIKYLFKYINKGPDRVTAICTDNNQTENANDEEVVDEIKDYYDCRYLSACEACWRILGNEIHYRFPAVERLPFHLPGQQQVVYEADDDISDAINKPSVASLKFLGWMECNKTNDLAKTLTYVEFPTKFVWKAEEKVWQERKRGYAIGRIHYVPPSIGEAYYLRVLLHKQKGPEDWDKIKEVNDIVHPTYRDACYAMGLLDDDREYIDAIEEANSWACGEYVRKVFERLLTSNTVSRPDHVWNETWRLMCDDIEYEQRELLNYPGNYVSNTYFTLNTCRILIRFFAIFLELELRDTHLKNLCLQSIDSILRTNGSSLDSFPGMPLPDMEFIRNHTNVLIHDELCYNKDELVTEHETLFSNLTSEQKNVYTKVMTAVEKKVRGVFFLYGYGGTGKTYVWRTLSAALRSKGEIVLNVASSGIASLLLSGGRTAHSRFAIPINVNEESFCSIKPGSDLAALLEKTSLIIWDEAPMMHKHCFESLDRTLRDILGMKNKFGENGTRRSY